jgi:UDP-GlcNAc:undecaprenyl-phosphate GlcNAc-1-phosphate transferase
MHALEISIPLLVAFAASACLTPLIGTLARRTGVVDHPSDRSVSKRENLPLMGGLAIAAGTALALVLSLIFVGADVALTHLLGLVLGGLVILGVGIWDDRFGLGAAAKFAGQLVAAVIAVAAGFQLGYITEPISQTSYFLPRPVAWAVSLLWIVGVTNALNLIDGLDGLATGVGSIICATLTVIVWQAGEPFGMLLGVALLGGMLGFLPYNFPPARIFLGDTGALFIGFMLALLSLEGYRQVTVLTFVVPLFALAVPILDTALSILRRVRTGRSPFRADRLHIHHRLLATRGSPRAAVLQFYFLTACFSLIAVSFTDLQGYVAAVCLLAVFLLTLRLLANLGVLSFAPTDDVAGTGAASVEEDHP